MLKRHTFRVQNYQGKWTVHYNGSEIGSRRLFLKNSAIEDARSLALANQPSEVLVEEADGNTRTVEVFGGGPRRMTEKSPKINGNGHAYAIPVPGT